MGPALCAYTWDTYPGRWFFEENGKGPLRKGVREKLVILSTARSMRIWDSLYDAHSTHPALLPGGFFSRHIRQPVNWEDYWREDEAAFISILQKLLPIAPETEVFFFWSRVDCIATDWEGFTLFWDAFLYDDEFPLLYIPELSGKDRFDVQFGPHGELSMPPLPPGYQIVRK